MKNEIIFSYRLIKLIYYLIALYVAITYVNEISKYKFGKKYKKSK